ncbi:MAG TPA: bifunctional homocysteine S-methyltransferase/methylenetetrahydrofolate reductase, partial [Spirochaetia bacterium]
MARGDFRDLLRGDRTILFDGAMGTMLYERGVFLNRSFEEVCLSDPRLVLSVHRDYIAAGADVLTTNSWGAGLLKLRNAGLAEKFEQINARAVELARQTADEAGRPVWIAGSIGPLGVKIEPLGSLSTAEAAELYGSQARVLAAAGADLLILETFVDVKELAAAVRGVRRACDLPVIASLTINSDGTSLYGTEPEVFGAEIDALEPDAVGLNCSEGPKIMLDTAERMVKVVRRPMCVQPNAGVPVNVDGRNIYQTTPTYMAKYAKRMIHAGVRLVGGCCGTTPAHIREMRDEIRAISPALPGERVTVVVPEAAPAALPLEKKSAWAAKLARGEFVTCVELVPPRGLDVRGILESGRLLKSKGIDAVNVPDSPRAQVKMGAIAAAVVLQREAGIEAIPHITCKDKNLLALQADLLGSHALGIRNILVVTGDPPNMGTYPDATAVFNVDAIGLANLVNMLNHGYDLGHNPVGAPTGFCYGVALNPGAVNPQRERERFLWKLDAGAEFAITQPVFDAEPLLRFLDSLGGARRIPVVAGIWPLTSLRNAEFMKNEVPGVIVPDAVVARMARCDTREAALEE